MAFQIDSGIYPANFVVYSLPKEAYSTLLAGGSIGGHILDENALYFVDDDEGFLPIEGGTITGNLTVQGNFDLNVKSTSVNENYYIVGTQGGTGTKSLYQALNTSGTKNTTGVYFNGSSGVLYGAAWNDYAEFRQINNNIEPGRVVCETGRGDLVLATERLQPGAEIVSDTFGFAIGETDVCKTPIAVSGRVLAYPYEDKNSYCAGDAVCAGPNGTVSRMTREEIINYPDRIIGTVSEIPNYEVWGQNDIKVNNRIWIRIK